MENDAKKSIVPEDWDDFVEFISQHRDEIAHGSYDLRIEKDWARDLTPEVCARQINSCRPSAYGRSFAALQDDACKERTSSLLKSCPEIGNPLD